MLYVWAIRINWSHMKLAQLYIVRTKANAHLSYKQINGWQLCCITRCQNYTFERFCLPGTRVLIIYTSAIHRDIFCNKTQPEFRQYIFEVNARFETASLQCSAESTLTFCTSSFPLHFIFVFCNSFHALPEDTCTWNFLWIARRSNRFQVDIGIRYELQNPLSLESGVKHSSLITVVRIGS